MRVLLTGGAGYIGSHAVQTLLEKGLTPLIYDNLSTGVRNSVAKDVPFIFGDIRDGELLARVMKDQQVEAVIHFAAKNVVPDSVAQPLDYYENNVIGTLQVIKACQKNQVKKIIFSSSASVYGDPQRVPVQESDELSPSNPYGESKRMGEKMIEDAGRSHGLKFVILRYFNVAGARMDLSNGQRTEKATHLIKVAAEAACGVRQQVEIYGQDYNTADGTGLRDYIHIEDLVEAHVLGLEYLTRGGASAILNCGYGRGFTVKEVLQTMKAVSEKDFAVVVKDRRPGDIGQSFADTDRIRQVLKWQPRYDDLTAICKSAFLWEKKQRGIL